MKIKFSNLSVLSVLLFGLMFTSCGQSKKSSFVATMDCDKTFENVIYDIIGIFENVNHPSIIGCRYVTQKAAIDSLMQGETQLIVVSRDLDEAEIARIKKEQGKTVRSMKFAVDAVALIVNPDNPVQKLSMNEIKRILTGEVQRWSQIEPGAPDIPIHVVLDDPSSSLSLYMRDEVLKGKDFDTKIVLNADSVSGVFNQVKKNKGAIGIIGVSWLTKNLTEPTSIEDKIAIANDTSSFDAQKIDEKIANSGVKTLGIMNETLTAYRPTQDNIYNGDYPLTRPMYMITTAPIKSTLGKFYTYVNSVEGQRFIMSTGVMPARVKIKIYEISQ